MRSGFILAVCCVATLSAADPPAPQAASTSVGTISSTAGVMIDGTMMARGAAPSWPLADQDEIATTSAPAQVRTFGQNAITLQSETRARIRSTQPGQLYIYLRSGGLTFDTKAIGVSICAHDRLFIPATPAKGSVKVAASGVTTSGSFGEAGQRPCDEDGLAGLLTGLPGTGGAAGGTAIGTGTGGAAGGVANGAGGGVVAVAGIVAVGAASAAGLATTAGGGSTCTSPAGCNFNAAPPSSSGP
jgi:hypothetical protein